ncbi:hypothetical protein BDY21DRAFT_294430 [Lineolata rhizophorae]|uniref:Uncharacterized protein n=1 Tax=Lineolata rhizophorae TaxID=578093 RepID=A0A6A6NLK4_9PEZI|nr:hypothetical protein BDY21DRAFT_294430 [Lineolata rhizophorae]
MEPPFTLASLPASGDRASVAPVRSLVGSRKRKRPEIAVGLDGEGVNVYNNPALVASYAFPPGTRFTASPCCLHEKLQKKQPKRRFTYAPISTSRIPSASKLYCFSEDTAKDSVDLVSRSTWDAPLPASPVLFVDVLPSRPTNQALPSSHDVLALQKDGRLHVRNADLSSERWSTSIADLLPTDVLKGGEAGKKLAVELEIEFATLTDAASAREGILKDRGDILAALDVTGVPGELAYVQILCVIVVHTARKGVEDSNSFRQLHLFSIWPRNASSAFGRSTPRHLLSSPLKIGTSTSRPMAVRQFTLHAQTGIIQLLDDVGSITTYNVSGLSPRMESKLSVPNTKFDSMLRLSPSLIIASSNTACGVYDTKFNSVHAQVPLRSDTEPLADSKKRKSSEANAGRFRLCAYFSDIGLAVGLSGSELIGLQLGAKLVAPKKVKTGPTLVDSIGKGVGSNRFAISNAPILRRGLKSLIPGSLYHDDEQWQKQKEELDMHCGEDDVFEFEKAFAEVLGIQRKTQESTDSRSQNVGPGVEEATINGQVTRTNGTQLGHSNGDAKSVALIEPDLPEWVLSHNAQDLLRYSHQIHALYALSKTFSWVYTDDDGSRTPRTQGGSPAPSIKLDFYSPNVFRWLAVTGYMTTDFVQKALQEPSAQLPSSGHPLRTSVAATDLVGAIVSFDPEMRVLYSFLYEGASPESACIVHAAKCLFRSLLSLDDPADTLERVDPLLLTNGVPHTSEAGVDGVDNNEDPDAAESEALIASTSTLLSRAMSTLDHGLSLRSASLRLCLSKLAAFPHNQVVQALREGLERMEILSLIQLLREELAEGGWTRRYVDDGPEWQDSMESSGSNDRPDDRAIPIIAGMLSCALDAIGLGGWLADFNANVAASSRSPDASAAESESAEAILHALRLDISVALEGIQEATFLAQLFDGQLTYDRRLHKAVLMPGQEQLLRQGKPFPVAEVNAYMPGMGLGELESSALPLGLKVANQIGPDWKVTYGRRITQKSKRDIGRELSKRTAKYSVEKIKI